jgi:hypothetical protein
LGQLYGGYDAAVMLYVGAPLAVLGGSVLAHWRAMRAFKAPVTSFLTSFDVELKARYMLHDFVWGHPTDELGTLGGRSAAAAAAAAAAVTKGGSTGRVGTAADVAGSMLLSSSSSLDIEALESQDDTATQGMLVRSILTPSQLDAIEGVLAAGMLILAAPPAICLYLCHELTRRALMCVQAALRSSRRPWHTSTLRAFTRPTLATPICSERDSCVLGVSSPALMSCFLSSKRATLHRMH